MFKYLASPFPHAIANEFFTETELSNVWEELNYLSGHLNGPEVTGSARTKDGEYKKKNLGVFVDGLYSDRNSSSILTSTAKFFAKDNLNSLCTNNFIFNYLPITNLDFTLVQFYANGDYYKAHHDTSIFTLIILLHKKPKKFQGGELVFTKHGYELDLQNNQAVLFPSFIEHEVKEVVCPEVSIYDGRITITKLIATKGMK
jgi:hypothetical protein